MTGISKQTKRAMRQMSPEQRNEYRVLRTLAAPKDLHLAYLLQKARRGGKTRSHVAADYLTQAIWLNRNLLVSVMTHDEAAQSASLAAHHARTSELISDENIQLRQEVEIWRHSRPDIENTLGDLTDAVDVLEAVTTETIANKALNPVMTHLKQLQRLVNGHD